MTRTYLCIGTADSRENGLNIRMTKMEHLYYFTNVKCNSPRIKRFIVDIATMGKMCAYSSESRYQFGHNITIMITAAIRRVCPEMMIKVC
jgi:hypothetical protein